jgi:hypothetical protein
LSWGEKNCVFNSYSQWFFFDKENLMNILESQREMRSAFFGGFAGQLVSGLIWLLSAAVATWISSKIAMAVLFFGSMGIFPLTQLVIRLLGRPGKVGSGNGLWPLGSQVAFTVPINFILVGAATLYRETWFFPAAMIVVGSHYLPFITLYGMKMFAVLAILLVFVGVGLVWLGSPIFSLGGWVTGILLIIFAFAGRKVVLNEENQVER